MNIAVINTGGTISCVGDPLSPMTAAQFAAACTSILNPIIAQQFPGLDVTYITDLSFPESSSGTLDSTNLQPTDWCLIASYILRNYASYDGWVVLHGTDSMDFTGTALPFLISSFSANGVATGVLSKPIIITGSQVPMFYQAPGSPDLALNYNTDAYQNFCGAVAAAQSGVPEVCVYFQNHLYRGCRVLKTNASEFDAFSSPNYAALGEYGITFDIDYDVVLPPPVGFGVSLDNEAVRQNVIAQIDYVSANINSFPVMQFNAFPAWYTFDDTNKTCSSFIANMLNACVAGGVKGIILESYGEGNFPSGNPDNPSMGANYQALYNANANGVVIVDCTQVPSGVVNDSAYAAGAWLPAVGALSPADMTPMAAFAKLMILLTAAGYNGWSTSDVKNLLQLNLLGEMMSTSRLDSRGNAQLLAGQSITTLDGSAVLLNDPQLGPTLRTSAGEVLWCAIGSPSASDMPGRLIMQNDGNLVFYSRSNAPLWATNTGVPSGASSFLVLGGSTSDDSVSLEVYDYSANMVTATLYPSNLERQANMTVKTSRTPGAAPRSFKFSGRIAPDDRLHQVTAPSAPGGAPDEHYIAPTTVSVTINSPPPTHVIGVPQYAPTVVGGTSGYNPAGDCNGNFMSCNFQPNNNCYAYGCNITTNTFPQPGRASGYLITTIDGPTIAGYAEKDGLLYVGTSIDDIKSFVTKRRSASPRETLGGHLLAPMISPPRRRRQLARRLPLGALRRQRQLHELVAEGRRRSGDQLRFRGQPDHQSGGGELDRQPGPGRPAERRAGDGRVVRLLLLHVRARRGREHHLS